VTEVDRHHLIVKTQPVKVAQVGLHQKQVGPSVFQRTKGHHWKTSTNTFNQHKWNI